jgi:hypothetical protein
MLIGGIGDAVAGHWLQALGFLLVPPAAWTVGFLIAMFLGPSDVGDGYPNMLIFGEPLDD